MWIYPPMNWLAQCCWWFTSICIAPYLHAKVYLYAGWVTTAFKWSARDFGWPENSTEHHLQCNCELATEADYYLEGDCHRSSHRRRNADRKRWQEMKMQMTVDLLLFSTSCCWCYFWIHPLDGNPITYQRHLVTRNYEDLRELIREGHVSVRCLKLGHVINWPASQKRVMVMLCRR